MGNYIIKGGRKMANKNNKNKKVKKENPPFLGLAIAVMFWMWGILLFYIPTYLNLSDNLIFNILGFLSMTISFAGAFVEMSNLRKNEAYSYWGVSLVFLIPAILLHLAIDYYDISNPLSTVIKIILLILLFIGFPFIPIGFAYLFEKPKDEKKSSELSPKEKAEERSKKIQLSASIIITILSLSTAIIQLIAQIS